MKITQVNLAVSGGCEVCSDRRKVSENGIRFVWRRAFGGEEIPPARTGGGTGFELRRCGMIPRKVSENGIGFVWRRAF